MIGAHSASARRSRLCKVLMALGVAVLVTACGSSGGSSSSGSTGASKSSNSSTWTYGLLDPKGDSGYELMAQAQNFYKQFGVDVQVKYFVGNVQLTQAVVSGSIDAGETSLEPPFSALTKGANLKVIGSTLVGDTYAVVAKSSIKSWQDLQGKTIGASSPGSFPDTLTRAVLATKGLDPQGVRTVSSGDDAQRLQALTAGRLDAAAMSVAFIPQVNKNSDLHVLGLAQDIVPQYPRFMIIANGQSLKSKPQAAVGALAATMRGVCYALQNPQAEQEVTGKAIKQPANSAGIVHAQQVIAQAHAASPTAAIPMNKLTYLQDLRIKYGFQKQKLDLSKVVDNSFRQKALKQANLPAACGNDPNANT